MCSFFSSNRVASKCFTALAACSKQTYNPYALTPAKFHRNPEKLHFCSRSVRTAATGRCDYSFAVTCHLCLLSTSPCVVLIVRSGAWIFVQEEYLMCSSLDR